VRASKHPSRALFFLCVGLLAVPLSCAPHARIAPPAPPGPLPVTLCAAQDQWRQLHNTQVILRAVAKAGAEGDFLLDPTCSPAAQRTALSFVGHMVGPAWRRLVQITNRPGGTAWVTLRGTFVGPVPVTVDPALPDWLKSKLEGETARYGHFGSCRYEFRATTVSNVVAVSATHGPR
jgi:hypothetical protein